MLQKVVVANLKTWAEFLIITLIFHKWKLNVILILLYGSILYFLFYRSEDLDHGHQSNDNI